ncbi:tRNA pseudouridine(55) synthase TruB [Collinsella sp. AGMB00827]|uniref:tRNA pseudouridine synthase B n=1 Tax=Collinsella ureilytica TaxID=2869515 RepID=A0ABS7MLI5_9ACTN|nr:tRNA pseudouridine(55) synthase TruB [Collinsella urealyticum]MBY4797950.1 tRNA pseudouridine(55) synthase TruB [Collinsella urealyticum]
MARHRIPSALNLLLGVNKPAGMTSHDVVARVRRAVGERRVGHAGTLDPAAEGVMIVGIGQATRLLGRLTLDSKRYIAKICFGTETDTDDGEGAVIRTASVLDAARDPEYAREVLAGFCGSQDQVPPAFSAISVDGVRSHRLARAGKTLELEPRRIVVYQADLLSISSEDDTELIWTVGFHVSKGTYIRSLARDIGRSLGSAAHLSALMRTASGSISRTDCIALDEVHPSSARHAALDPIEALGLPTLTLTEDELVDVHHGRPLARRATGFVALQFAGKLQALGRGEPAGLAMDLVFPEPIEGVRS